MNVGAGFVFVVGGEERRNRLQGREFSRFRISGMRGEGAIELVDQTEKICFGGEIGMTWPCARRSGSSK
jgi:hypothetical protein